MRWVQAALFALLAANAAIYAAAGTLAEALDSAAWLALLALFSLEACYAQRLRSPRVVPAVRGARLAAAAAIVAAAIGYAREHEWLDAANSALWIGVAVLLEFEVRRPVAVARARARFAAAAAALYAGLGALALGWAWRGEWFDAYDAALWLAAFALIEREALRPERSHREPSVERIASPN